MSSKVKRQHYVWRYYLRAWANQETIWTHFKELRKIEKASLMGVAQEKYFYQLVDFTESEEKFLKTYIDKSSPNAVKGLNFDFLALFTSTGKLKNSLLATTNPSVDKDSVSKEIEKLEINLMEHAHGKIEGLGTKLLSYRSLADLQTITQDDYYFDAIMFICFQYFRTKGMKKSALKTFIEEPYKQLAHKAWNVLSYVTATTMAKNISLSPDLKFTFIENNTSDHFITSDQPVFNLLNDQLDENGEVTDLEFYYPITPNHALSIHFNSEQSDKFARKIADEKMVSFLNKKVMDNSDFFVFADTKEQLEKWS
jgi:hypothetical protein